MAAVFPSVMTSLLARTEITSYFAAIKRHRVDVPTYAGAMPLLQVYVTNNAKARDAGSGKAIQVAHYTAVVAGKMRANTGQDELIGEMTDVLILAAQNLVYNAGGHMARVIPDDWAADDNIGEKAGDKVWVEVPLAVHVLPI